MSEYRPGLEGVVAARTAISEVDGQNGRLIYRGGYLIQDLAETCSYEEVIHLLWTGELPTAAQLAAFSADLAARRGLKPAARGMADLLPAESDPMDAIRSILSAQGAGTPLRKPNLDEAKDYTAALATAVAAFYRRSHQLPVVEPRPDLGHAANFLYMMSGEVPAAETARWIDTYLILLADHGLNASTFTARVIASTNSDLCSALVGAVGALKGPAHGGAASAAMAMLKKIGSAANAEPWLTAAMDRKERFMGFGHRVYRTYDPRARILRELCKTANPEFYATAIVTEEVALRLLHERHPERPNATNVDYWSAGVLSAAGIPDDYFTAAFAVSRVAGWCAHVLELVEDNRLIRPASEWIGPAPADDLKPRPLAQRA